MEPCQLVPNPDAFASGMIAFLDCQAQNIGMGGYRALAVQGSSASLVLSAFLTIFVALIGYRMLFGDTPSLREAVLSVVKIGVVLALATGWPAYQVLIYEVVLRAPAELAAEIGGASGLPGATGGLPARLDGVDRAFETLAVYGPGVRLNATTTELQPDRYAPPPFPGFDTFAIGTSRAIFLASAIGGFALVRLGAGLLLALGPLFLAFLLFDATRGLFEGWARALIATALGSLVTAILLGVELALFEPWLSDLIARRAGGEAIWGAPAPLLAISSVFAIVLGGLLLMVGRIGFALKLSQPWRVTQSARSGTAVRTSDTVRSTSTFGAATPSATTIEGRSRALAVADSIASTQRREEQSTTTNAILGSAAASVAAGSRPTMPNTDGPPRLGQSYRRRTGSRVSASAGARDARA
ncbi:type IV secretion system protein [uncultured Sphingomonas sp.]|uniref:type IV secretion system protein n=1 Tax=uncultured Sphingomonas sp. TaxID=158754 RepID=UPI0015771221